MRFEPKPYQLSAVLPSETFWMVWWACNRPCFVSLKVDATSPVTFKDAVENVCDSLYQGLTELLKEFY